MTDIPVPGRPGETIEALTDEEVEEVVDCRGCDDFPESWVYALAVEVGHRRLQVELLKDERDRYKAEAERLEVQVDALNERIGGLT
jgi:hypothetical protein